MKKTNKIKNFFLNNKLKLGLILIIFLLTIGYAAVNTSLSIIGNTQLARNPSFKVFLSSISLDGVDIENQLDNNRESFTIKQSQLKELGTSTINYEIKNAMTDYDAKVSISCSPEHHNNTSLNYDGSEKEVMRKKTISGTIIALTSEPTKEKIYDIVKNQSLGSETLLNYSTISSASNGQGVYSTKNTDSGTVVYFYRGNVTNNNVIFAGHCWQIMRTTETDGVKLLYNGVPNGGQCQKPSGNGIATIHYNSSSNDNAYVGYMYGTPGSTTVEATHANQNDSLLKKEIDKWYEQNILGTEYENYIEDTVWCNDRSISSGAGIGQSDTQYGFFLRTSNVNPSLKCTRIGDRLTVESGYLKYPIATLTADELWFAGIGGPMNSDGTSANNTTMFLNNGGTFWTLTPNAYSKDKSYVQGISYFGNGNISTVWTNIAARTMGVRPAISLKNEVTVKSGDGSFTTPYTIGETTQKDTSTTVDNTEYTCKLNVTLVDPNVSLIGKEYCFGTECFNIIGYEGGNFKLLSKYNLLVGQNASSSSANYGHQDPSALADKVTPAIGTLAFGTTNDYTTSTVKTYVDNYVTWLNNTYNLNATGRLIENSELLEIGCQLGVSQGCSQTYNKHHEWLLRTTFYTQTKQDGTTDRIYLVGGDGFFGSSAVNNSTNRGVRPVIIVSNDKIDIEPPKKVVPVEWLDDGVFTSSYAQAFEKLQTLSLSEKVGQLLVVSYAPGNTSDAEKAVTNYNVGGVLFFENAFTGKTIDQVKSMTNGLQEKAKVPLMMAVDEEGGRVVRISPNENLISEEKSKYPNLFFTNSSSKTAWKLASTLYTESGNNFDLVTQEENVRNNLLKKLGLNMNFAPVVDIATPPAYISDRSFGNNPQLVAEYATAVINAGKNSGVSHSLKHFPGYGNNADTHTSTSVDETSLADLHNTHLVPFKAGIKAGAHAVMITHNIISALDKTYPASLSEPVHNLLFNDLGFTGIAITDDLAMQAIGDKYSNQYLKAFKAGNHILLASTSYAKAHDEILAAVNSGEITEDELDKRVFKVLAWKYHNGIITE